MKVIICYDHLAGKVNKSIREMSEAVNALLVLMISTMVTTTTNSN